MALRPRSSKRRKPSAYDITIARILGKGWRKGLRYAK